MHLPTKTSPRRFKNIHFKNIWKKRCEHCIVKQCSHFSTLCASFHSSGLCPPHAHCLVHALLPLLSLSLSLFFYLSLSLKDGHRAFYRLLLSVCVFDSSRDRGLADVAKEFPENALNVQYFDIFKKIQKIEQISDSTFYNFLCRCRHRYRARLICRFVRLLSFHF
jgi:hypothetical protein